MPGSKLLEASLSECEGDDVIRQALLHVHTANTEALDWYQHRGFKVGAAPSDCCSSIIMLAGGLLLRHVSHRQGCLCCMCWQAGRQDCSSVTLGALAAAGV